MVWFLIYFFSCNKHSWTASDTTNCSDLSGWIPSRSRTFVLTLSASLSSSILSLTPTPSGSFSFKSSWWSPLPPNSSSFWFWSLVGSSLFSLSSPQPPSPLSWDSCGGGVSLTSLSLSLWTAWNHFCNCNESPTSVDSSSSRGRSLPA